MKKRVLSLFLALTLCFSLLPTAALAEEAGAAQDTANAGSTYTTGEDTVVQIGEESDPVQVPQALIDALPEDVTAENAEEIEQQLFEVHEQIADNRELREALTPSRRTSTEARVRLAESVFAPHISAPAMSLVDWCVRHHAEGGPLRNLRRVVELAAEMRRRTIVDVVTAIPMTSAQEERLRTILERRLGTRIDLNCEVDSAVIGGARISTRNYVMDRTVRSAVAELRTRLAG